MEGFELIKQGAEAKLYKGTYLGRSALVKERFVKKYRHPDLDSRITHDRIKGESRIIARCKTIGVQTPLLYLADLERRIIIMEYFENNITVKDFITKTKDSEVLEQLANDIGCILGKLHKNNIIHGDLTTSNMLLVKNDLNGSFENYDTLRLIFIDFGLAYVESSSEDKGVDLYVLERALTSTHSNCTELFSHILKAYIKENMKESKQIINKYEEVRARGRKRTMVG